MAKYLDLTGLSHYDQKIKQYIAQHSGGGSLYRHYINVNTAEDFNLHLLYISNSNTPITTLAGLVSIAPQLVICGVSDIYDSATGDSFYPISINGAGTGQLSFYGFDNNDQIKILSITDSIISEITDSVI